MPGIRVVGSVLGEGLLPQSWGNVWEKKRFVFMVCCLCNLRALASFSKMYPLPFSFLFRSILM